MAFRPPDEVCFDLEEAIHLLVALEQARDALLGTDFWSPIAGVEHQIAVLVRKLGLDEGGLDG
jgi:hypothetical protein